MRLFPDFEKSLSNAFSDSGKSGISLVPKAQISSAQRAHINFNIISNPLSLALYVRISIARLRANITPLCKRHITCAKGTNIERATRAYKKGFCCKEILAKSLFLFPQKPLRVFVTGAKTGFVRAAMFCGLYLRRLFYYQTSVFSFLSQNTFRNGKFLCLNAAC